MTLERIAWINGKALDQLEIVKPLIHVSKFVPVGLHCPEMVGYKFDLVPERIVVTCKEDRNNILCYKSFVKRRRCWLHAMDPLADVEEQLGRIECWPTSVITDIFTTETSCDI